jgi:hypothetical protein
MKFYYFLIVIVVVSILVLPLPACNRNQSGSEKIMDKVGDVLDKRPGERAHDTAEEKAKGITK